MARTFRHRGEQPRATVVEETDRPGDQDDLDDVAPSKMVGDVLEESIAQLDIRRGVSTFYLLGKMPLICNRLQEAQQRELIYPDPTKRGRKTAADLMAGPPKHDPLAEYRGSIHRLMSDNSPTLVCMPTTAFKGVLITSALDVPGTKKSQVGRLAWVEGARVPIYGAPQMYITPVKTAGMVRTPDMRTRAILPEWCCEITVNFQIPMMKHGVIHHLLASGGYTVGIGDYRQEKGKSSYGQFVLVDDPENHEEYQRIRQLDRAVQLEAMQNPEFYDQDTQDLYEWYVAERQRRSDRDRDQGGSEAEPAAPKPRGRPRKN